ncbi:MAG: PspA/IM30 family protein [Frankiales bacterium]|nr:PspA/IM30 family protein [Frankiales bacterium]
MSLGRRLSALFKGDGEQDPQRELEVSYDRQVALLQQTRRGAADVATSRRRLELQLRQLEARADALHAEAVTAVGAGDDDRARVLLTQHAGLLAQIDELGPQEAQLRASQEQLDLSVQRLGVKVEAFRSQKDVLSAGYTAAEAQARTTTALAGVDEELGDAGFALQRARDRTEAMQAKAQALDELTAISTESPGDAALRRLQELSGGGVDAELARLKDTHPLPGPLPTKELS